MRLSASGATGPTGCEPVPGARLTVTAQHVHVAFDTPRDVLGSAVLNGGWCRARHLLNLRVNGQATPHEPPETTLQRHARRQGWSGTVVGMMTAASLASLRVASGTVNDVSLAVLVTCGLSNLRRSGDRAEHRLHACAPPPGTINIQLLTSASLTPAAMAEALMMITEAKTAALHARDLRSPVSGLPATGTGTDALLVASDPRGPVQRYCGKHVLFGEVLGRLVLDAVGRAVDRA